MSREYLLRYAIDSGVFTPDDAEGGKYGLCDAGIWVSILRDPSGWSSTAFISCDGRTGDALTPLEVFKAWSVMASALAEAEGLSDEAKAVAKTAFESVKAMILRGR